MANSLWTVSHDGNNVPFENFQQAVSYADQLVNDNKGVKLINLDTLTIEIKPNQSGHWAESEDEWLSGAARQRRATELAKEQS
jgi:hypothetical protein